MNPQEPLSTYGHCVSYLIAGWMDGQMDTYLIAVTKCLRKTAKGRKCLFGLQFEGIQFIMAGNAGRLEQEAVGYFVSTVRSRE